MSAETMEWLNRNVLVGFTDERGNAWHYRASDQGDRPNHYPGAIPVEDVEERLFGWEPAEGPVKTTVEIDGQYVDVVDRSRKVIVRPDTLEVMGTFKSGYQVHGYQQWLIENVENILDTSGGDLQIGSAGLLRKGAVAWVQFELPQTQEVSGVLYRPFLTSCTSLDGSLATTYKRGAQIVVCDNTLQGALGEEGETLKYKHSRNSLGRLSEVRDALGIVHAVDEALRAEIERLSNTPVGPAQWAKFVEMAVPLDVNASQRSQTMANNKRSELQKLWTIDPRVAPWSGTAYGVLAAMNTYDHHFMTVRGASRPERNMLNMVTGATGKSDNETLTLLHSVLSN